MSVSQNPCQYCPMAFEWKGRRTTSIFNPYCRECIPYREHQAFLESKRMFASGDPIRSLDELLEQTWVMFNGRVKHIEVIKSAAMRTVLGWLQNGLLRKAIKKEGADAK